MVRGGLPLTLPATNSRELLADGARRSDGIVLAGGDDVDPRLYANGLPARVRRTVGVTPDGGQRDFRELVLIDEVFRQRKPLLAICRGHQILNVALGGTLLADIPRQRPDALNHCRTDLKDKIVHQVTLDSGSLLAQAAGCASLGLNSSHHPAVATLR